jgi:hypothetical protein
MLCIYEYVQLIQQKAWRYFHMRAILFSVVATFAVVSFSTISCASEPAKPFVPAGPVYAILPGSVVPNDAEKAAETRKNSETRDAKERAETELKDAKEKADSMTQKAKAKADAAAKDTSSTPR